VKAALVILLAILGLLFLILAAFIAGGVVSASGGNWLLPAGLATWCASWLVSVLPIP
jgi:hypothetical protein